MQWIVSKVSSPLFLLFHIICVGLMCVQENKIRIGEGSFQTNLIVIPYADSCFCSSHILGWVYKH